MLRSETLLISSTRLLPVPRQRLTLRASRERVCCGFGTAGIPDSSQSKSRPIPRARWFFMICPNVLVLFMQRLGDRLGSGEDGLVFRECRGQRRGADSAAFRRRLPRLTRGVAGSGAGAAATSAGTWKSILPAAGSADIRAADPKAGFCQNRRRGRASLGRPRVARFRSLDRKLDRHFAPDPDPVPRSRPSLAAIATSAAAAAPSTPASPFAILRIARRFGGPPTADVGCASPSASASLNSWFDSGCKSASVVSATSVSSPTPGSLRSGQAAAAYPARRGSPGRRRSNRRRALPTP